MRGAIVEVSDAADVKFQWVSYVVGGFLIFSGIKMLVTDNQPGAVTNGFIARTVRKIIPVTRKLYGGKSFLRTRGLLLATPLLLVLVLVEICDVVFAVDSI